MDNDTKAMLFALGIATSIGALTGLGLSFTTLSPLVMGGIVGSIFPALITALFAGVLLYKFCKKDHIERDDKGFPIFFGIVTLASAATGVGLAAAATAISPSIMLGMGSAALAGAIIAPIAVIAGFLITSDIIEPIAQKVNEYIISPIVERFSSKGEEKAI
ncbi:MULTISPECIES: hypothetical protein [Wolbachia]|uniref:hypothetical protein n=1 Tax=Wolbachia TaxID=953 RepID=UPI0020B64C3D|nr:hypothetical protein [Wolbachia pipientis]